MYTSSEISKINQVIRENWYAKGNFRPTLYLLTTLVFIFILLFQINNTNNPAFLGIFLLFLVLCIMRMFMIFHDLTHRSYFPSNERKTGENGINIYVAKCIDFLCSYDANMWRSIHSEHHRVHGNINEIDETRTVYISSRYNALPEYQKILYNIIRFPPIFFLLAPIYIFWINKIFNHEWEYMLKYIIFLNILYHFGSWKLVGFYVAAQYIAGIIGIMLFHLQHQVNVGYWKPFDNDKDKVAKANAELHGASVLQIPCIVDFFTFGIEYHNVHHLDPGIPGYNTRDCYYDLVNRGLISDNKIGYLQSFKSLMHTIYDEETGLYK
jgi:omega-6 fatty acid desaturase (delta-12 desaturase)